MLRLTPGRKLICAAGSISLGLEQDYRSLLHEVEINLRNIFEINSLLINIIDQNLLACCEPGRCIDKIWNKKIIGCFVRWSSKRDGLLISYLVGDGANIDSIANRLSTTLEAYNENFQKISNHNILADRNLNALARLGENLTNYERFNYQNTLISSVLSAGNNKRLQKSLELSTGLQRLKTILKDSDIESSMTQLSNALLEINIPCIMKDRKCTVLRDNWNLR